MASSRPERLQRWVREAWYLTPLAVFAASRALVHLIASFLSVYGYPVSNTYATWDAGFYERIALHGYSAFGSGPDRLYHLAFLPVVPFTARAMSEISPMGVVESGVVLSLVTGAVASVLIWRLVARRFGDDLATTSLTLLCFAPSAWVLSMFYTESVMLLCVALVFWWLDSRRWWLVALAAAIGGLTRPTGFLFFVPVLVVLLGDRRRGERTGIGAWVAVAAGPAVFGGWLLYVAKRTGHLNGWFDLQQAGWGSGIDGGVETVKSVASLLTWSPETANNATNGLGVVFLGVVGVLCARHVRVPSEWFWYAVSGLVLTFISEQQLSGMRYLLPFFPLFVGIAGATPPRFRAVVVAMSATAMGGFMVMSSTTLKLVP